MRISYWSSDVCSSDLLRKTARDFGRNGGVVDKHGAGAHRGKRAVLPQHHLLKIGVRAHTGEDGVRALGRLCGRIRPAAAMARHPFIRSRRSAIIDTNLVAGLPQMRRHGETHYAKADKCCFHPEPRSEENTSELQTLMSISSAVFGLKK